MATFISVHKRDTGEEVVLDRNAIVSAKVISDPLADHTEIGLQNGDRFEIVEPLHQLVQLSRSDPPY